MVSWDPPYTLHTMCECLRITRGWSRQAMVEHLEVDAGEYARWADGAVMPERGMMQRVERCFGVRFVVDARGRIMGIAEAPVHGGAESCMGAVSRHPMSRGEAEIASDAEGGCADIDRLIDAHLHEPVLPAAFIAEKLGSDRITVEHLVRSRTGLAWNDHVWMRRVAHARMLLLDSGMGIGVVARSCGFRHDASFSRAFRRRYGLTPRDFRRELRQNDGA